MNVNDRAKVVMSNLVDLYVPHPDGGMAIDSARVMEIVRKDPEAVAYVVQKVLAGGGGSMPGWGLWMTVAHIFQHELADDSLIVLVEAAASAAGASLPKIKSFVPNTSPESSLEKANQIFELQMAELDVAAGDAHRMVLVLRLDRLTPETRRQLIGNCIITFPADGDPRPVQHIARIRAFAADLHKRIPHFPLFLNFSPEHHMWLTYFGCLADPEATKLLSNDSVRFEGTHPTVLVAVQESLIGLRDACDPLSINWESCANTLVAPFDADTRRDLLRRVRR